MQIKLLAITAALVIAALGVSACGSAETNAPNNMSGGTTMTQQAGQNGAVYHKISQEDAKARMDKNAKVVIVDVRSPGEFKDGHIKNAINIPLESINSEPKELPDKNAEILVYCHSGRRSKLASDKLVELGYKGIYDFGGINTWKYEVVK
jgi:phage shock protein E